MVSRFDNLIRIIKMWVGSFDNPVMINFIIAAIVACLLPVYAVASPGQSGSSGLVNVSTAETLDSGNICIGLWSCYGKNDSFTQKSSLIVPVSITLGIGTFWEVYGAYPNILFNGDEDVSGRGTLDFGTKIRFLGDRSSIFKMAVDLLSQRHISENRLVDGVTDLSGKLIVSYNKNDIGLHVSAGYSMPGTITGAKLDDQITFGAGLEYMLMPRMKLLGEFTGGTKRYYVEDNPTLSRLTIHSGYSMEVSAGLQYYLSPHLTLNASAGTGLGSHDPENKFILGLSSCQGVGTYVKPIPSVGRKSAAKDKTKEALKPLKIIPISSLLLKASAQQSSPVSKLEVEVDSDKEEVLIKPYGQITIAPQQASSNLTSPVIPVEIPLKNRDEEISLQPSKTQDLEANAIEYTMNRIRGITPLYGVDVKGAQVSIPKTVALPERMSVYRRFRFPDVSFDFDQWTLSSEGKKMLSEVAEQIRKDKKWLYLKIDGHTDGIGSLAYNMDLSLKRAIAAATYLISNEGIEPSKIFIKGLGKSSSISDNATADGRRKNRRTEILLLVSTDNL